MTGTPQGGILSPLLANIALSVLDDYVVEQWRTTMKTTTPGIGDGRTARTGSLPGISAAATLERPLR
jgi:hypothetical protein